MPGGSALRDRLEQRARFAASSWKRSTAEADVGPVEAADDLDGSRRRSSSTISARTGGAAVAVSASTGGRPSASIAAGSSR